MKALFLLALSLLSLSARADEARVWETIYRGKAVDRAGQSWKSTVGLNFESEKGGWFACSGVFIAEDLILTAAHCQIKNGGLVQISLYKENSPDPTVFYVDGKDFLFRAHPRYRKGTYDAGTDDVAVLVLKDLRLPADFAPSPVIHSGLNSTLNVGNAISVVGAGRTEKNLMSDCIYFAQGLIESYEPGDVMRVNVNAGQGVCGGDSGGPVFVRGRDGTLFLAALTTAVETNLRNTCGNVLYANFLSDGRYRWVEATAGAARRGFWIKDPVRRKRPVSDEASRLEDI
jgi:hypothetical protein